MDLPDTATHRNRQEVVSQTSSRRYIVSQRIATGVWECSCPGWTTHRKCKHLQDLTDERHWMCIGCQGVHRGTSNYTSRGNTLGLCCWCGLKRTYRIAPALPPHCENIHLDDVS